MSPINLIKGIFSHNICSGIKSEQAKKTICHSEPKTFDFSQNSSAPFHWVPLDHSVSCVLLIIDKPKERQTPKTPKKLKEMPYPPQKKPLKRKI